MMIKPPSTPHSSSRRYGATRVWPASGQHHLLTSKHQGITVVSGNKAHSSSTTSTTLTSTDFITGTVKSTATDHRAPTLSLYKAVDVSRAVYEAVFSPEILFSCVSPIPCACHRHNIRPERRILWGKWISPYARSVV